MVSTIPIPTEPVLRLSVAQYHAMIETGILTEDDPVELINGWLIEKMPKNPRHRAVTKLVRTLLESVISDDYYVDSQEPITLSDSELEPDVMIIRGGTRDYLNTHPQAKDIILVVEVSDTTLVRDQTLKKNLYARHGISNYWIINLINQQLEIYTDLNIENFVYDKQLIYSVNDPVEITVTNDIKASFNVSDILA